ncbi:hypothetical protein [Angustibacter aerolatus]
MRTTIVAGVLLLSACSGSGEQVAPSPQGTATTSKTPEAPLSPQVAPALYQLPVQRGERVSDGALVVQNTSGAPVRLLSVDALFHDGVRPSGTQLLAPHLVVLDQRQADDSGLGIQRRYPPAVTAGESRRVLAGSVLEPGARAALVLGLRLTRGAATVVAVRVVSDVGGRTVAQLVDHQVMLCTGRPRGSTTCPAPS